jgi:CrcB protein
MILVAIAIGGAAGSVLRYLLGRGVQRVFHTGFPVGTLTVNLIGCIVIGVLAKHFMNDETAPVLRAALMVGVCGGFTTFSTFTLETMGLVAAGDWARASLYVVMSVAACLAGTFIGFQLTPAR